VGPPSTYDCAEGMPRARASRVNARLNSSPIDSIFQIALNVRQDRKSCDDFVGVSRRRLRDQELNRSRLRQNQDVCNTTSDTWIQIAVTVQFVVDHETNEFHAIRYPSRELCFKSDICTGLHHRRNNENSLGLFSIHSMMLCRKTQPVAMTDLTIITKSNLGNYLLD
jgi:hypothetical protein